MSACRLVRIALTVTDLDRSVAFYENALGFTREEERIRSGEAFARLVGIRDATARTATLRLGAEQIELFEFARPGALYPADSTSPDLWFQHFAIPVGDMAQAYAQLLAAGGTTPISTHGPVLLPEASGGVTAYKFRDPDLHPLELIHFPPETAPAKWKQAGMSGPCLGIDHSAIAVADTSRAEALYVGWLGLSAESRSLNRGETQEALDGTFNTMVEVTGLAFAEESGPHLELLCNRVPATGRPIPVTLRVHDIAATRLVIETDDLEALVDEAVEKRLRFVSPGIVVQEDGTRAALLHDLDGHLLQLVQA